MKDVFTTGQVARICKVATRTVNKWFDMGKLRGHRDPGSKIRRVPRANLIHFLQEYGMPLGELEVDLAPVRQLATQHRRRGRILAQQGEYAQALKELDEAQAQLSDERTLRLRGHIYYRLDDYAKALADLNAVLSHRRDDKARHLRARIHYRRGSYHAALNDLNDVISSNPQLEAAYRLRAQVYRLLARADREKANQLAGHSIPPSKG